MYLKSSQYLINLFFEMFLNSKYFRVYIIIITLILLIKQSFQEFSLSSLLYNVDNCITPFPSLSTYLVCKRVVLCSFFIQNIFFYVLIHVSCKRFLGVVEKNYVGGLFSNDLGIFLVSLNMVYGQEHGKFKFSIQINVW